MDDLYLMSVCKYGRQEHIPFSTVDRAYFPGGLPRFDRQDDPSKRVRSAGKALTGNRW